MPNLTFVSFYSNPIGRESAATYVRVFSIETNFAIINHFDECEQTAALIKVRVNWWKILNVKTIGVDIWFKHCLDKRLHSILQFGEIVLQMKGCQGKRPLGTDPLEKEFGNLFQGFSETYLITVQQIMEKVNISKPS